MDFWCHDIFRCHHRFGYNGSCNLHQSKKQRSIKSARRKIRIGAEAAISAKQICRFEANFITDDSEPLDQTTTIFRNLQDYISGVDRNSYAWEKMGQAQMKGILSQYNPQNERQSTSDKEDTQ